MVWTALEAADKLAEEGISAEVVDLRTLLPLDRETVCESVKKTSKVLLLHEDTRTGGMAGELAVTISESVFEYLDAPIVRVTAPDTPVPYSPPLEEAFLPNAEKVVEKARWLYRY
jgi:2-oxoisovalerate dehydrogenase E1 component beta subunit